MFLYKRTSYSRKRGILYTIELRKGNPYISPYKNLFDDSRFPEAKDTNPVPSHHVIFFVLYTSNGWNKETIFYDSTLNPTIYK